MDACKACNAQCGPMYRLAQCGHVQCHVCCTLSPLCSVAECPGYVGQRTLVGRQVQGEAIECNKCGAVFPLLLASVSPDCPHSPLTRVATDAPACPASPYTALRVPPLGPQRSDRVTMVHHAVLWNALLGCTIDADHGRVHVTHCDRNMRVEIDGVGVVCLLRGMRGVSFPLTGTCSWIRVFAAPPTPPNQPAACAMMKACVVNGGDAFHILASIRYAWLTVPALRGAPPPPVAGSVPSPVTGFLELNNGVMCTECGRVWHDPDLALLHCGGPGQRRPMFAAAIATRAEAATPTTVPSAHAMLEAPVLPPLGVSLAARIGTLRDATGVVAYVQFGPRATVALYSTPLHCQRFSDATTPPSPSDVVRFIAIVRDRTLWRATAPHTWTLAHDDSITLHCTVPAQIFFDIA